MFLANRTVYENMWESIVHTDSSELTIKYGACTLPATDTHSEYVILHAFHGNNDYANVRQCYVTLCYVMLCYVMLCCVMLGYVMLCYTYISCFVKK